MRQGRTRESYTPIPNVADQTPSGLSPANGLRPPGRPNALMTVSGPYTQGLQFIRSWLSVWTSGSAAFPRLLLLEFCRHALDKLQGKIDFVRHELFVDRQAEFVSRADFRGETEGV